MKTERKLSLRRQLILLVIFCWVLPIVLLVIAEGILLNRDYERSMRQEMELAGSYALEQTMARFNSVFEESKTVSYDGVVRSAYRSYQLDGDSAALYRTVSAYLRQRFSHTPSVRAMFLSFWNEPDIHPYMSNQADDRSRTVWNQYEAIRPDVLSAMQDADTKILILPQEDRLYVARNLLDSHLKPYATVVILCDNAFLAEPLASVRIVGTAEGLIDGDIRYSEDGRLMTESGEAALSDSTMQFSAETGGHTFTVCAGLRPMNIFEALPDLKLAVYGAVFLILPLMIALLAVIYRQVTVPLRKLMEATSRIQQGERGYMISDEAGSREFQTLYLHFNNMSMEMKRQFEHALLEQQALQQARIRALQSQINPHFLNNTLEVINWEARIAGNDKISAMIEALGTMLSAALDRDGIAKVPLREELKYVDAYLYIIRERMGDRLQTEFDIDETLYEQQLPRLILQPVVENAVEHDISNGPDGRLTVRAFREAEMVVLEVEHSGHMTDTDRENIRRLLAAPPEAQNTKGRIGIRNVNQRLKLLYGEAGGLSIEEIQPGVIAARICFPAE